MSKHFHYQGHPVAVSVKIHNIDVTADLRALDDIQKSVDYPNLTEFRVGECAFTLRDSTGDYAPNNPNNFWTRNMGHRTGYQSPVEIRAGFIVNGTRHLQTVFKGQIIRLVQTAKQGTVKVICTDNFSDMRKTPITDFGVPRHFKLTEDLEQSRGVGVYPILKAALPAADGSVTLQTRSGGTQIEPVQKLQTAGHLDPLHYIVTADGIHTEGDIIVNRGVGYPQVEMKSPFRYRALTDVVADILTHAGITQSDITIPEQDVPAHFSSNGRVNYTGIGTIADKPITWQGYVTDMLQVGGERYFLYNGGRDNPNGVSQLIVEDIATRTETQLHTFAAGTEVWKFTKTGNDFYVVATTGGSYDANLDTCQTKIIKLAVTPGTPRTVTETTFVADSVSLQPQLAHYYFGVGTFMLPDTRRALIYRPNDGLYYVYCSRATSEFGVAKATQSTQTAVITVNQDTYGNHAGIDFSITASGVLTVATTFLSGARSQTIVCKKTL